MRETQKYIPVECDQTTCPLYQRRSCVPAVVNRPKLADVNQIDDDAAGEYSVDIAVIGSPPSAIESNGCVPFIDDPNTFFRKLINLGGQTPGGHALLPVIRCMVPTDVEDKREVDKIREAAIQHCKKYLHRDINTLNPKVVLLSGPEAILSVTGEPVLKKVPGIRNAVGSYGCVEKHTIGTKKYTTVKTIASDVFYRQTSGVSYVMSCIDKARDIAANGAKSIYHPMKWKTEPTIHYCDTVEKIEKLVEYLINETNEKQVCCFDVETVNLNVVYGNNLVMLQFCVDPLEVWCVPYQYIHAPFDAADLLRIKESLYRLFTETPKFSYWVGHGVVFDMLQVMAHITNGKTISNRPILDTQTMFYVLDENRVELSNGYGLNLKLKTLSKEALGRDAYDADTLQEREAGTLYKLEPKELTDYAGNDVVNTYLLYRYCRMVAKAQGYLEKMMRLCIHLLSDSLRLTAVLRKNGMFVPLEYARMLTSKYGPIISRMKEIEERFKELPAAKKANAILAKAQQKNQKMIFGVPWVLDINTMAHRIELFINQLKLRPLKHGMAADGSQGPPSMDDEFWEKYKDGHEEALLAQEYFGLKKLSSSYATSILEHVDPQYKKIDCCTDSRIRPSFTLTGTTTGRVASFNPNGQNFPKSDNAAKAAIKSLIQAQQANGKSYKKGSKDKVTRVLLQNDFVTAEVRVWAILSHDQILADAINTGTKLRADYRKNPTPEKKKKAKNEGDQHRNTAATMFSKKPEDVTDDERQAAKRIVFGLMYGRGARAIAEQLKNPNLEEVQGLCDQFSNAYPDGVGWFYRMEDQATRNLCVESDLNRRRKLYAPIAFSPDLPREHPHRGAYGDAKRQARNSPIQSESSDFGLIGSFLFLDYIEKNGKDWKIINIVHDSCVAEIPLDELKEASKIMEVCFTTQLMEYVTEHWGIDFVCPLEVECEYGVRWGEMEKWDGSDPDFDRLYTWLGAGGVKEFVKH